MQQTYLRHFKEIFRPNREAPPWARMGICAFATFTPLAIGYASGDLAHAIYGALIGYLIALNDHLGKGWHRALVAVVSYLALTSGFLFGFFLQSHGDVFIASVMVLVYWLGLMGAGGTEVERMILFSIIEVLLGFYARKLQVQGLADVVEFATIGVTCNLVGILISWRFNRGRFMDFARLRPALMRTLTADLQCRLYAFCFALSAGLALVGIRVFNIPRGYWTLVTMVLVMRPNQTEFLYRSIQRLSGTFCGVLVGALVVHFFPNAALLISLTTVLAFLIPLELRRNYTWASFMVTMIVLFLLSMPSLGHLDANLPWQRLQATGLGCGMCLVSLGLYRISLAFLARRQAA